MRIIPRTNAFRRGTPPIRTDYIYVTNFWRETLAGFWGVFAVCSRDLGAPTCCRTHVRYCGGGSETPTCRWAVLASRPTDQYRSTEHRRQERHQYDASPGPGEGSRAGSGPDREEL